ncbi:hypothetical protein NPIL_615131 [Nephila pilipes]|uniref:Uncharacterized protein n=1 Tax=Nephila pilipes TaxID=299642 RepID=A0A8X6UGR8_NEPPI|nr:hypothetical protein NPIL_615131 [Nephila pilipes]
MCRSRDMSSDIPFPHAPHRDTNTPTRTPPSRSPTYMESSADISLEYQSPLFLVIAAHEVNTEVNLRFIAFRRALNVCSHTIMYLRSSNVKFSNTEHSLVKIRSSFHL